MISEAAINNPDQLCWYLLDCAGHSGAVFNVITDGEIFYPTNRVTDSTKTVRLADGSGKRTVDLKKAGPLDKDLIHVAIEEWVSKMLTIESKPVPTI